MDEVLEQTNNRNLASGCTLVPLAMKILVAHAQYRVSLLYLLLHPLARALDVRRVMAVGRDAVLSQSTNEVLQDPLPIIRADTR